MNNNTVWIIDAQRTESFPPFVFWEYDPVNHKVLDNFVVRDVAPGFVVGIYHDEGPEKASEFYNLYKDVLHHFLGESFMDLE